MDIKIEGDVDPLHTPYQIKSEPFAVKEEKLTPSELLTAERDDFLMNSNIDIEDECDNLQIDIKTEDQNTNNSSPTLQDETIQTPPFVNIVHIDSTDTLLFKNYTSTCKICNKTMLKSSMGEHMKNIHGNRYFYCEHCDLKTKYKYSLIGHMFLKHLNVNNNMNCNKCKISFKNENMLKKHNKKYHMNKCHICNTECNTTEYLKLHIENLHNNTKSHCYTCKIDFNNDLTLKMHIQFCHGDKTCQCTHCGKLFKSNSLLNSHLKSHSKIKQHQCNHCINKGYRCRRDLNIHLNKIHNYLHCNYCNVMCRNAEERNIHELELHLNVDKIEDNYPCVECDLVFKHRLSLKEHFVKEHE